MTATKRQNGQIGIAGICFVVGALGFAVYDADRFRWAGKIVAAFVLSSYVAYAVEEWFFSGHKWNYAWGSRSAASPMNSLWGLLEYGFPALCYLVWDRFHWREKNLDVSDELDKEDWGGEDWDEDELMDDQTLVELVRDRVRLIPAGEVMSFGQVGDSVGCSAREAGWAMNQIADENEAPWQRVVGSDGYLRIAKRSAAWAERQRTLLESEGVMFKANGCVDMARHKSGTLREETSKTETLELGL